MKKVLHNILNFINRFSLVFTIICLGIATLGAVFNCINTSGEYLNSLILILLIIIYILAIIKIYKFINKLNDKQNKIISSILLVSQFLLLFLSTKIITSIPKVDLIHMLMEIKSLNETGTILDSNYFSIYPHNKFLVIILYGINKISPANNTILFELFSSLCITLASLFTYKTVKFCFGSKKALLSLIFCVFSPIFYIYASYYYTDVFMLPFASILIYLLVRIKSRENIKRNIFDCILVGIISIIGYKIRAVTIFILIAFFVYLTFKKNFKKLFKLLIPITMSLILTLTVANTIENHFFKDIDESKKFPITHWIMMGLNYNSDSHYSRNDYQLTYNGQTPEEKKELNIQTIKSRIKKQGIKNNIALIQNKIIDTWGKGDYGYQKYYEIVKDYNIFYRYLMEKENILINYILQASKIVVLLLCITSLVSIYKKKETSIIAITLFGAIVFYLFWESHARYGLSFLPAMILLGSCSYDKFNINLNKLKNFQYFKEWLVIMTVVILGVNFIQYTKPYKKSNIVAKNTVNYIKNIPLNKDTILTQSLKLKNDFNEIKLKFHFKQNINSILTLTLLNEDNNIVYNKEVFSTELNNNEYTSFKLDKTYPKGKYIIKLSSPSDNNIYAYIAYQDNMDFYPNGILLVNNKEELGDLMLEINNIKQSGTFSYIGYIIFVIITLGSEYIILFKKEGSKNEK